MSKEIIKVLRVIPSMNPKRGGPSQGLRYAIPRLKVQKIYNEVICLDDPDAVYLVDDEFKIHAIGKGKGPLNYHSGLILWLRKYIRRYDVVVVHGLWSYHSYAVTKVIRQFKKNKLSVPKVYVMPHGMLDPWFQRDKTRKFKAIRNEIYWRLVEKRTISCADGVLFTCQQELLLARQTFKDYKPKEEINVGYGIASPPVFNGNMTMPVNKPYWLFMSRIHPKKGISLLITAYLRLQKVYRELPDLVIAGPGMESSYGKDLLRLANQNAQIHFTGMLQGDSKWGALYGCETFVLPSHQENFGIAVVEALACRKPVLISDQVNIWREIEQGEAGIVKPDTIEGTYDLLLSWYNKSLESKQNFAESAFNVFQNLFTIEENTKKIAQLLAK